MHLDPKALEAAHVSFGEAAGEYDGNVMAGIDAAIRAYISSAIPGEVAELRRTLPGIAQNECLGDNLAILLAGYFEPGIEDDEMDDSETWKQGAIDAANHVLDAIHAHYATALSERDATIAELERQRAHWLGEARRTLKAGQDALDRAERAESSLAEREAEMGREWQPIETAPKDGSRFLAFSDAGVDFFHWQDHGTDAPVGWGDSFIVVYREGDPKGLQGWMPIPSTTRTGGQE